MKNPSAQQRADLRVCASCKFIFSRKEAGMPKCPMCDFTTYGARYTYGDKAYRYKITQKPFFENLISFNTSKAIAEGNALITRYKNQNRSRFMSLLNVK